MLRRLAGIVGCLMAWGALAEAQVVSLPDTSGIVFTELRFTSGCLSVPYIEVFNRSNQMRFVATLRLAQLSGTQALNQTPVDSRRTARLLPNSYLLVTSNKRLLMAEFPTLDSTKVYQEALPFMQLSAVQLVLLTPALQVLQAFAYDARRYPAGCHVLQRKALNDSSSSVNNWWNSDTPTPLQPPPAPPVPLPEPEKTVYMRLAEPVIRLQESRPGFTIAYRDSLDANLHAVLVNELGREIASWEKPMPAGEHTLPLELPAHARLSGGYALYLRWRRPKAESHQQLPVAIID